MGGATQPPRPQNTAPKSEQGSGPAPDLTEATPRKTAPCSQRCREEPGPASQLQARAPGGRPGTQGADGSSCEASERSLPNCTPTPPASTLALSRPPSAPRSNAASPMEATVTPPSRHGHSPPRALARPPPAPQPEGAAAGGPGFLGERLEGWCCGWTRRPEGPREPREGSAWAAGCCCPGGANSVRSRSRRGKQKHWPAEEASHGRAGGCRAASCCS